ncbi:MAG TPA: radical SAM protein, partial [Spirochaetales bacterium]|nr:radical SAM protein [Spirochaetales bacterium]
MTREAGMALGRLSERAFAVVAGAWPVEPPAPDDVRLLLDSADEATADALKAAASRARDSGLGPRLVARALIEISSYCGNSCRYCGLNACNRLARRYSLSKDEIVESASRAFRAGLRTIVLQSGEDGRDTAELSAIIGAVKRAGFRPDAVDGAGYPAVTLSLGERPEADYAAWKEAGADRYLMRMETGDRELYAALHDGRGLDSRLACHAALRRLGYQLGSGIMVGLPGQSVSGIALDLAAM